MQFVTLVNPRSKTCSFKKLGIKGVKTIEHIANNGETSTWQAILMTARN